MIPSRVISSAEPDPASPRRVAAELRRRLAEGARLLPAGTAHRRPGRLVSGYPPNAKVELFDTTFLLAAPRQNELIRFFVAYVIPAASPRKIFPRIFYKDVSLTWRSASHTARIGGAEWIGKGCVETIIEGDEEVDSSNEATTDLPLEIQSALEDILRRAKRIPRDERVVDLVLRRGPDDRIEPYRDFLAPRERAAADPRNLVHRGRPIARFTRRNDPASLRFVRGFEPDFRKGIVEHASMGSRLYGGRLQRFRITSTNRRAQYLFMAGPHHAWIASCQATTTELSSYGVRSVDAVVPEDLLIPGFEYHFMDDSQDPPALHSQIPPGFAGAVSVVDDARCDATAWLDRLPVIREFRRVVLSGSGGRRPPARRGRGSRAGG